jgi:hypothetical protein
MLHASNIASARRRVSRLLTALPVLLAALCSLPPARAGEPAPLVGHITFALGTAQIVGGDGVARPAQTGGDVHEGDQLRTEADGWLHLRMVDDAFVALRPGSTLRVTRYAYDPARPADSQIRLDLDQGNARAVSGRGGEAARRQYRFGTPLAAIGLRGTDYTVRVVDDVTRVSVRRGAVSVTPIGEGCSAAGLGPCDSTLTRELTAQMPHAYLELSARNPAPALVLPAQDPQGGAAQNPTARPAEPEANNGVLHGPIDTLGEVVADQVVAASVAAQSVPTPPPPPAALVWGRWSSWASGTGAPAVTSLLSDSREVMVGNDVFSLLRDSSQPVTLPTQGVVNFNLANSEAYTLIGGSLGPAQVRDGSLGIDFRQRTFETTLAVQHPGGRESLQAAGAVQWQGFLIADPTRSSMNLQGALSRDGAEAAYLFDKPIAGGELLGAVRWLR